MLIAASRSILVLSLVTLGLPGSVLIWNYFVPDWIIGADYNLYGTRPDRIGRFTITRFWSGEYQRQVGKGIVGLLPFFSQIVRSNNELNYRMFGRSSIPWVIVGKREYLFAAEYVDEFCSRDLGEFRKRATNWMIKLRQIQKELEARGKFFVYVITPSKAAHMPHMLPSGYPCRSVRFHQSAILPIYRRVLEESGIRYVDGTAQIWLSLTKYGYDPFPRGGIHWTLLSAYPASQSLIQEINNAMGRDVVKPFEIHVDPARLPEGQDRDYADLLNVVWTPIQYLTSHISPKPSSDRQCEKRIALAAVGGSFTNQLAHLLMMSHCPPLFWLFSYMTAGVTSFHDNRVLDETTTSADYDLLENADGVILEENEEFLGRSRHGPALYRYLLFGAAVPSDD